MQPGLASGSVVRGTGCLVAHVQVVALEARDVLTQSAFGGGRELLASTGCSAISRVDRRQRAVPKDDLRLQIGTGVHLAS